MKIDLTTEAEKQFLKLPKPEQKKVERKLKLIKENPLIGKKLSGEYTNQRTIRAWPYRILYIFHQDLGRVTVVAILHRQGAYKP